jgi:hypothetical protein
LLDRLDRRPVLTASAAASTADIAPDEPKNG